jgi:hypothetical protein
MDLLPITRVYYTNTATAASLQLFRNRQALWPSGRVTALRTWYTSRHQDDASKDLQPCFIHARQKRSVRRYLAAV